MEILYKSGKENVVADTLSRIRINLLCPLSTRSLRTQVIKGYKNSSLRKLIKEVERREESTKRYMIEKGLLYYRMDEFGPWRLCLPNIQYRNTMIHDNHDLAIAGHSGYIKTYSRIAWIYYWPNMDKDIRKHVQECDACQRTKPSNHPPAGWLHPLSIPKRPWESIGMDNLGSVPKSAFGKDMILIVIDRLTKMARFIPTYNSIISKGIVNLFLWEVFRHHGLSSNIVSDRDPHFTAKFWDALQKALDVQLLMSIAAHPQTDGQSEAVVKVIQKLLKPFVFQGQDVRSACAGVCERHRQPSPQARDHRHGGRQRHDQSRRPDLPDAGRRPDRDGAGGDCASIRRGARGVRAGGARSAPSTRSTARSRALRSSSSIVRRRICFLPDRLVLAQRRFFRPASARWWNASLRRSPQSSAPSARPCRSGWRPRLAEARRRLVQPASARSSPAASPACRSWRGHRTCWSSPRRVGVHSVKWPGSISRLPSVFASGGSADLARGLAVTDYYDELALDRAIEALAVAQRRIATAVLKDPAGDGTLDAWLGRRSPMVERVLTEVTAIAEGGVAPSVSAIGVAAGQIARTSCGAGMMPLAPYG